MGVSNQNLPSSAGGGGGGAVLIDAVGGLSSKNIIISLFVLYKMLTHAISDITNRPALFY